MSWTAVQPDGVAVPKPPISPVVVSGDHVFTAGQVAFDAAGALVPGGVAEQTRQVLANLRGCLEACGCTFADVIKVNAFLVDLTEFETFNEVYRETFSRPYPVRTTVQAGLAPGLLVEIEAVARRPAIDPETGERLPD